MASPEDEETDAFMAVQKMDAEFKMQAAQQKLDPLVEANALQELMTGKEMSTVESACCSLLSKEQWEHALQAHSRWNEAGLEATGREVARVVDELDAPHLKPTGIMERIKAGNAPACHGLVRLLSLMKPQ